MERPGRACVRRRSLLARLAGLAPQIVALVAPAGFGKSTFARQFVQEQNAFAICDCAQVGDDLDFARRLVPALAEEMPQRGAALSTRELMLGDGTAGATERVWLALAAWRERSAPSTFVFENAEYLLHSAGARDLFTRLLADRPESRRIVICSRETLRLHLSRFALPHQIVTLRACDLAFTEAELDEIFASLALSTRLIERIMAVSQGWPIAVLLFARFASEERLEALLDRMDDIAFEELHDYLADQVIGTLPSGLQDALYAAACIPCATSEDIAAATGSRRTAGLLADFAKASPFVTRMPDGAFVVHPLMSAMLLDGERHRRDDVLAVAADVYERQGDHLRAAELHLARPHQASAARTLECVPVAEYHAPPMRYSRVLASLDRRLVRRYPTLCSSSALIQVFCTSSAQLLAETSALWCDLPADTSLNTRSLINTMRAMLLSYTGQFKEALALVDALVPRETVPALPETRTHAYALFLRGLLLARLGRIDEGERELQLAWPLIETMDVMASAVLMVRSVDIALVRGQYAKADSLIDRSIECLRPSDLSNYMAYRLAEAAFSAWFSGDDERFERFGAELQTVVERDGVRAFAYFSSIMRAQKPDEPSGVDLPRWITCGQLVGCSYAPDSVEALRWARAALVAARSSCSPFLRTLAAIAVAELASEVERAAALDEAGRASLEIDSAPLQAAVRAVATCQADLGMLKAYVERRLRQHRSPGPARLEISIIRGVVHSRGTEVSLSDRELSLLFALAVRPQEVSRDRLVAMLWPELDVSAARNALHVTLHRVRQRLRDEEAIVRTVTGYKLCSDASVDLWDVDRRVSTLLKHGRLSDEQHAELKAVYDRARTALCARVTTWEWFDPVERRISEIRCELAQRLARHALERGNAGEALALADEMIEHDPCDESAREIAISAHLASGDRAAALRAFRRYRETLRAELQCDPSRSLAELVGVDPVEPPVGAFMHS